MPFPAWPFKTFPHDGFFVLNGLGNAMPAHKRRVRPPYSVVPNNIHLFVDSSIAIKSRGARVNLFDIFSPNLNL